MKDLYDKFCIIESKREVIFIAHVPIQMFFIASITRKHKAPKNMCKVKNKTNEMECIKVSCTLMHHGR